jgi:linoleoyl-CoA desaturase
LFFYKFLNYFLFLGLPLLVIDLPWPHILLGFLLMHFVGGLLMAVVFMLAHAVEGVHFPHPDGNGKMENSWLVHQLHSTANFARDSRVASFLTGGLNLQIEHHLFPHICSIHYGAISRIVKGAAQQYGHPYIEYSFTGALQSHYRFLRAMGREQPSPSQTAL